MMGNLAKQLPNRFYASIEGQLRGAVEYHPIIIDVIRVRDPDSVRALMFRHIYSGAEHLIAMLERQDRWRVSSARDVQSAVKPAATREVERKPRLEAAL